MTYKRTKESEKCLDHLQKHKIPFEIITHEAVYTIEEAMRVLPGRVEIKNLFIQDDKSKRFYLVVMPGQKKLDLKQLAVDVNEKKVRFVSAERMKNMLEITPGSVSIFCLLAEGAKEVTLVFDNDLLNEKELGFHPLDNEATVFIDRAYASTLIKSFTQKKLQMTL